MKDGKMCIVVFCFTYRAKIWLGAKNERKCEWLAVASVKVLSGWACMICEGGVCVRGVSVVCCAWCIACVRSSVLCACVVRVWCKSDVCVCGASVVCVANRIYTWQLRMSMCNILVNLISFFSRILSVYYRKPLIGWGKIPILFESLKKMKKSRLLLACNSYIYYIVQLSCSTFYSDVTHCNRRPSSDPWSYRASACMCGSNNTDTNFLYTLGCRLRTWRMLTCFKLCNVSSIWQRNMNKCLTVFGRRDKLMARVIISLFSLCNFASLWFQVFV